MLRFQADLRPIAFNIVYFALVALAFSPLVTLELGPSLLLLVPLCVTAFQGAVQTHNAIHSPIFRSRPLNKVYQVVLTLIYGHPVSSYVPGHNLSHHKHTQSRKDVMRTTKARFSYHLLNLLFFFFCVAPSIMRADSMYTKEMRAKHPRWFRQMLIELAALYAVSIALFIVDWRKAIVFWIIPHIWAQWGIVTMNILQHDGCDGESKYNHSRNFIGSSINWWVYNNGFHTVHHEQPGLHWSLAPEVHARTVAQHIHPALDQPSLATYLWKTFVLSNRTNFDGTPLVLPEEGPDENWLPAPEDTAGDLGAEGIEMMPGHA